MIRTALVGVLAGTVFASASHAGVFDTLEFEDLTPGDTFNTGSAITTQGVDINLEEFFFFPEGSGSQTMGFAQVVSPNNAGAGNGIFANNTNLNFDFPLFPQSVITFAYSNDGGNINLTLNGVRANEGFFLDLDGATVGGVDVSIATARGIADRGTVTLTGVINSFSVGGQEFTIDDVRYQIPTPGAGALLAIGALTMRRRR